MSPSDYYVNCYRQHFAVFWQSLANLGSVSRARRNAEGLRPNQHLIEYFSVVDFLKDSRRGFPDHLSEIPSEHHLNFLSATCYTVFIDQLIYTHFRNSYPAFRALTMYPKMDRTVGPARTFMMANPFEVFAEDILRSRSIELAVALSAFRDWSVFIASDLASFFKAHPELNVEWSGLSEALLGDPSCTWGPFGQCLEHAFRERAV